LGRLSSFYLERSADQPLPFEAATGFTRRKMATSAMLIASNVGTRGLAA